MSRNILVSSFTGRVAIHYVVTLEEFSRPVPEDLSLGQDFDDPEERSLSSVDPVCEPVVAFEVTGRSWGRVARRRGVWVSHGVPLRRARRDLVGRPAVACDVTSVS